MSFIASMRSRIGAAIAGALPVRVVQRRVGRGPVSATGYEAAANSRLDQDFTPPLLGPNGVNDQTLGLTRRRMRFAFATMSYLRGAKVTFRNNVVDKLGIYPQPNTGDSELDRRLTDLYWEAEEAVDIERKLSMADVQGLIASELMEVGEFFVNRPIVDRFRGVDRGPALQVIDTDRIDISDSTVLDDRTSVRQGVIRDSIGRTVGYRLFSTHPSDGSTMMIQPWHRQVIPATQADLSYWLERPELVRGIPPAASVLFDARMLGGYRESEQTRARVQASVAFWIKGSQGQPFLQAANDGTTVDWQGNEVDSLESGMMLHLPKDGEIGATSAAIPGPSYAMVVEDLLRSIAAGLDISYESLTRDFSKTSYSSARSAGAAERKQYRAVQSFIWRRVLAPFWAELIDWWVLSGKLPLTSEQMKRYIANPRWLRACSVISPGWELIDAQKEALATETGLRTNTTTLADQCGQRGSHWQDVLDQRIREEKYWREKRAAAGLPEAPLLLQGGSPPATPSDQAASPSPTTDGAATP